MKPRTLFAIISLALLILFQGSGASAVQSGISYHGRLVKSNGSPVVSSTVQFQIQIRTPGSENCLLYSEVQTKDLSQTNGVFSVTLNDGTGTRTDGNAWSIDQVFANKGTLNFGGGACAIGNSRTFNVTDGRSVVMMFNDGSFGGWEQFPAESLNFVPMAIEAQQVSGFRIDNLIRSSSTFPELNNTQATELMSLINGTSTTFQKSTNLLQGTVASRPAAGVAGRLYIGTDDNTIYRDDGATWTAISSSAATTLSVTQANAAGNVANVVTVVGGNSTSGNGNGGGISMTSGTANGSGTGGHVTIKAGTGGNNGGTVTISGGGNTGLPAGATLTLTGANAAGPGGDSTLSGGASGNGFAGGNLTLTGGTTASGSLPGSIAIGGGVYSNTNGTDITILAGQKSGTGTDGNILLATTRGKVGIGTTSPTSKLHVSMNTATIPAMLLLDQVGSGPSVGGAIQFNAGGNEQAAIAAFWDPTTNQNLVFYTGNGHTEQVRITGSGNFGIATNNPGEKLDVVGNIRTSGCLYYASSSLGACASDQRLKKDIHSFDVGLESLLGLDPVYFKYNGKGGLQADGKEQLGVIAQSVEKAAPSLVKTQMVKMNPEDENLTQIKIVDYGAFTYVLINAVKELYQKWFEGHESQQREIASLKEQNQIQAEQNQIQAEQIKALSERLKALEQQK